MKSNIKIVILILILISSVNARTNINDIDIDKFLNELKIKPTVILCKDKANTLDNYLQCLESNAKNNPTIENINFLAGIYASYHMYDKAIKTYKINVEKNDKEATYYLASIYNEALKEHNKAREYFEEIKEYKDSTCQIGGIVSLSQNETPINFINEYLAKRRTLKYYDQEIEKGNVKAYGCKGLYHNEFEEYKESEKLFLKGLEKGDLQNLFYLGNFYSFDYKYDIKKSLAYYERAYKEDNNSQAAFNLGFNNNGKEAIKWYMKAAKLGDLKALSQIGNIYRINGEKTKKYYSQFGNKYTYEDNIAKALRIYKRAGVLGSWYGNEAVWVFYAKSKQFKEGIAYLKEWYKKGYKECARLIGRIYEDHLKDYDKAIEWYKKGYIMGDSRSAFNLGYFYDLTLHDYDKAIEWYKKAYLWGDVDGAYNIAIVYEDYLHNIQKAIPWYKKAYAMGFEKAKKDLEKHGAL